MFFFPKNTFAIDLKASNIWLVSTIDFWHLWIDLESKKMRIMILMWINFPPPLNINASTTGAWGYNIVPYYISVSTTGACGYNIAPYYISVSTTDVWGYNIVPYYISVSTTDVWGYNIVPYYISVSTTGAWGYNIAPYYISVSTTGAWGYNIAPCYISVSTSGAWAEGGAHTSGVIQTIIFCSLLLSCCFDNTWKVDLDVPECVIMCSRGVREPDLDTPAIEKRFAYTFLQQLIEYVDKAHQHMMDAGTFWGST